MIQKYKNKAFTLIEILVVIAIIGILATIVIFNVSNAQAKSRDAKRIEDLNTVGKALGLYQEQYNSMPYDVASVPSSVPNPADPANPDKSTWGVITPGGDFITSGAKACIFPYTDPATMDLTDYILFSNSMTPGCLAGVNITDKPGLVTMGVLSSVPKDPLYKKTADGHVHVYYYYGGYPSGAQLSAWMEVMKPSSISGNISTGVVGATGFCARELQGEYCIKVLR